MFLFQINSVSSSLCQRLKALFSFVNQIFKFTYYYLGHTLIVTLILMILMYGHLTSKQLKCPTFLTNALTLQSVKSCLFSILVFLILFRLVGFCCFGQPKQYLELFLALWDIPGRLRGPKGMRDSNPVCQCAKKNPTSFNYTIPPSYVVSFLSEGYFLEDDKRVSVEKDLQQQERVKRDLPKITKATQQFLVNRGIVGLFSMCYNGKQTRRNMLGITTCQVLCASG